METVIIYYTFASCLVVTGCFLSYWFIDVVVDAMIVFIKKVWQ